MIINWELALKSFTDHSQALAVVILDGSMRYAWCHPELTLPLAKPEALLRELPSNCDSFRASRLGNQPCLLYLVSQPEGSRCAFAYPLTTQLNTAKADAQSFLKFANLALPVSLDSLKARDLPAYVNSAENETWQSEFLSVYAEIDQIDRAQTLPKPDDKMATQPVPIFNESTQPIAITPQNSTLSKINVVKNWVLIV